MAPFYFPDPPQRPSGKHEFFGIIWRDYDRLGRLSEKRNPGFPGFGHLEHYNANQEVGHSGPHRHKHHRKYHGAAGFEFETLYEIARTQRKQIKMWERQLEYFKKDFCGKMAEAKMLRRQRKPDVADRYLAAASKVWDRWNKRMTTLEFTSSTPEFAMARTVSRIYLGG